MSRLTRRHQLQGTVAALGGAVAAGCGPFPGTGTKTLAGEVEYWSNGGERDRWLRMFVAPFEKKNPGIKVNVTDGSPIEKVIAAVAAGTPPDIGSGFDSTTPVLASRGLSEPLDDLLKGTRWKATDIIDGLRVSHSIQGKVVQTPYISDALPLGINLELLDKANLKLPAKNWTWTDLAEYATKLTIRTGDETKQWGMLGPHMANNDAQIMFGQVLHSFGGSWADADGRRAAFASPQGVAALEFWVDLVRRRQVSPIPWPTNWTVAGQDPRLIAFVRGADGGVAMRQFQTFVIGQLKNQPPFRWQAVLPPQQPKLASIQGTGTAYMVKGAPHKDTATAFLLHLTDAEPQALFAADYARIPTYKTAVSHPAYQEFLKRTPELQVHAESALGAVGTVPPVLGWGDGAPALRQAILDAVSGTATPSAALRDAAAVMDSALAKAQGR